MTITAACSRSVLLMEDDSALRSNLRVLLATEGWLVHEALTDPSGLWTATIQRPDLIVLDLDRAESAVPMLLRLKTQRAARRIPVVVVTGDPALLSKLANQPIDGLLVKPFEADVLIGLIERVAVRCSLTDDATRCEAVERVSDQRDPGVLTARQREIAGLVATGATNGQIAATLVLTKGTVANHIAQILARLGMHNRTEIAIWAVQHLEESRDGRRIDDVFESGPGAMANATQSRTATDRVEPRRHFEARIRSRTAGRASREMDAEVRRSPANRAAVDADLVLMAR